MTGILFWSPILILTPPDRINFSELKYYKAVRCSEGTLKLVVKRSCDCLLIFCNMYHSQPSVCFTEASSNC